MVESSVKLSLQGHDIELTDVSKDGGEKVASVLTIIVLIYVCTRV